MDPKMTESEMIIELLKHQCELNAKILHVTEQLGDLVGLTGKRIDILEQQISTMYVQN